LASSTRQAFSEHRVEKFCFLPQSWRVQGAVAIAVCDFEQNKKPPRADQNNAVVVVAPFAPVVLESGVILALPVLTALNAALATNGIAKQQSNTKNNIIILCLPIGFFVHELLSFQLTFTF
jgi:hypothetical protein